MIVDKAKQVLKLEADCLYNLIDKLDDSFAELVRQICSSRGRVVITGIGKSGLIGKKIVATLISTGTHAIFLHPVEALHGDLGMVQKKDVVIAISNSGETIELIQLLPLINQIGCTLAGFTGNPRSSMAKFCDLIIDTGVEKEACPFNMAPTSSTTAQLAMGDALAVVLIDQKQFKKSDFIRSHPGGTLGQRLLFRVREMMLPAEETPVCHETDSFIQALEVMDHRRLGAVFITDERCRLKGIITDGDIRHLLAGHKDALCRLPLALVMSVNPRTLMPESFLYDALNLMETHQITILPVVDDNRVLKGMIHLHDILGKGEFKFNGGMLL